MPAKHQLGGSAPKGFAALHPNQRQCLAQSGGLACHALYGSKHMSKLGKRGAKAKREKR